MSTKFRHRLAGILAVLFLLWVFVAAVTPAHATDPDNLCRTYSDVKNQLQKPVYGEDLLLQIIKSKDYPISLRFEVWANPVAGNWTLVKVGQTLIAGTTRMCTAILFSGDHHSLEDTVTGVASTPSHQNCIDRVTYGQALITKHQEYPVFTGFAKDKGYVIDIFSGADSWSLSKSSLCEPLQGVLTFGTQHLMDGELTQHASPAKRKTALLNVNLKDSI